METEPTVKEVFKTVRALGCTCSRRDGEYRINYIGGTEASAYYTDDGRDAIETARVMVKVTA